MTQKLSDFLYLDENVAIDRLLKTIAWERMRSERVRDRARALVQTIRSEGPATGQVESFLQEYSLSTEEGIALMCLAEALLRIPDKATARELIKDKVTAADWIDKGSDDWMVRAAGLGLKLTRKTLDGALSQLGEPLIHAAMSQAMYMMSGQFVLGFDIDDAMHNAFPYMERGYRMSYDMLGEGARTRADAERYFASYVNAITHIGERRESGGKAHGISVKLSALHPRYSFAQKEQCIPSLVEQLAELCHMAASHDMPLTVDAEEADRLEISLDIVRGALQDSRLSGWEGFGLAVQAYQKRAYAVVDEIAALSKQHRKRIQVRLVKGAYWDTEIKRAQVGGMPDYPVFTRKENTDLSYLACAENMFANKDYIYPMFGTHNANTAAAIIELARDAKAPFEFQKLFGMGDTLYNALLKDKGIEVSIYAPVGPQEDLLAYLVRRLLENGANTSFVNRVMNPDEPVDSIVRDPVDSVRTRLEKRHPRIPLPRDIYATEKPVGRMNSAGLDLSDALSTAMLEKEFKNFHKLYEAYPLVGGRGYRELQPQDIRNPGDFSDHVGRVWSGNKGLGDKAMRVAQEAFPAWSKTPAIERAKCLERYADLLERHRVELMALCVREAGKTLPDAVAEIREAVDFARYYANRGREDFNDMKLPGPTGEENLLRLEGRGVFVCISPWNFPLAIFTGQITAALMAGNCVVAKPAEQTPLVALLAVRLLHEAGVPRDALNIVPGEGNVGAALMQHENVAGVAFTGSTEVAWEINKTLAARKGPIVPFIAETGGMNAMIVDSSALAEQVVDDALLSAFGTAGQRCSALRILCIQEEAADKIINMLQGGMQELRVGYPGNLSSDVGPVIDQEAKRALISHREKLGEFGKLIAEVEMDSSLRTMGHYFAPCAFELQNLSGLKREVFGPILHIVRYNRSKIADLVEELNSKQYGLTLGVHSRINSFQDYIAHNVRAGNVYVNRSIIGAVVGTQPFGGQGISGTGPKAGGPHYLHRFAAERVISTNTTAAGGNASLVSLEE